MTQPFPARYWHRLNSDSIECDLCPRGCQLKEGQRGVCFVRKHDGTQMVLETYGRSTGFSIDPIEKKPLYHFYPGSSILSFGTAGCNLTCKFCQNWDSSKSTDVHRSTEEAPPGAIARVAKDQGCKSVAITYNDPVIFLEYAMEVATACRELGVKVVAVTAGYINAQPREEFFPLMDAANVDLKAFTERFYRKIVGGHLQPVLDTLLYLRRKTQVWFEITNLLIPGENDHPDEIKALSEWVFNNLGAETPLHFSAFHPDYKMLNVPHTPLKTLIQAREIARSAGLTYVYTGNVIYPPGDTTFCSNCQSTLIHRNRYELGGFHIKEPGNCTYCGHAIAGQFEKSPGTWGSQRRRVTIPNFF